MNYKITLKLAYISPGLNAHIAEVINLLHHNKNITCYIFLKHTTRSV
jgi:hypothetical protein